MLGKRIEKSSSADILGVRTNSTSDYYTQDKAKEQSHKYERLLEELVEDNPTGRVEKSDQ